jgi:hypothetical protein
MKKIKLVGFATLTALCLATLTSCEKEMPFENIQASDSRNQRISNEGNVTVSGGGTTLEFGKKTTYVFNAVQREGKTTGHMLLKFRAAGGSLWVNVDCLRLFDGNKATMSGVITKIRLGPKANEEFPVPPFIYIGGRVSFTVQDNGEGESASPDLVSDIGVVSMDQPASCADEMLLYLPLDGNVQINN